jgi:hypothetical protein
MVRSQKQRWHYASTYNRYFKILSILFYAEVLEVKGKKVSLCSDAALEGKKVTVAVTANEAEG